MTKQSQIALTAVTWTWCKYRFTPKQISKDKNYGELEILYLIPHIHTKIDIARYLILNQIWSTQTQILKGFIDQKDWTSQYGNILTILLRFSFKWQTNMINASSMTNESSKFLTGVHVSKTKLKWKFEVQGKRNSSKHFYAMESIEK